MYGHVGPIIVLLEELAKAGHRVTLITQVCPKLGLPPPINGSLINTKFLELPQLCHMIDSIPELMAKPNITTLTFNNDAILLINGNETQSLLYTFMQENTVDVLIADTFMSSVPSFGKYFGVPVVIVSPVITFCSDCPMLSVSEFPATIDFFQRIFALFRCYLFQISFQYFNQSPKHITEALGIPFVFPNIRHNFGIVVSYFGLLKPQPIPPNVWLMGPPVSQGRMKLFNHRIEKILLEAEQQNKIVIYISFGTLVALDPSQNIELANAFRLFNSSFVFIWVMKENQLNFGKHILPVSVELFLESVPQARILNHSSVKVFISHCGANSAAEAVYFGMPVLAIPLFADQPLHAESLVAAGIAIHVAPSSIKRELVYNKLFELIQNQQYRIKAMQISTLIRNTAPLQEVVKKLEQVPMLSHYLSLLSPPQQSILIQYHLDFMFFFTVIIFMLKRCFACCTKKKQKIKED